MEHLVYFVIYFILVFAQSTKKQFCDNLQCENDPKNAVCGLREEGEGFRLKLFENQCQLLKYGCAVKDDQAYGTVDVEYCQNTFFNDSKLRTNLVDSLLPMSPEKPCVEYDCSHPNDASNVCGIKNDGKGFRVRRFENKCQLLMFNCKTDTKFTITDLNYCNGVDITNDTNTLSKISNANIKGFKPVFVVDASMFPGKDINETIDNFFAASHVMKIPFAEVKKPLDKRSRRMHVNIFQPVVIFKPYVSVPDTIIEDHYHRPTLASCFHKCPTKCPDEYAPVCGVPGTIAREPAIMFQNHCYMDVAQCKMYWENKSSTAPSSAYLEGVFAFCVGHQMGILYRFLPLVRTLQHMGRLKRKKAFKVRLRNMRYRFENVLRDANFMG